jgi:predicted Zn-dependent protease with MMP-like domain
VTSGDDGLGQNYLDRLAAFLERFDDLLARDPAAALSHIGNPPPEFADEPDVLLAEGEALWRACGAARARDFLVSLVEGAPDLSDARHMLAEVLEELGESEKAIEQHLQTLWLDSEMDALGGCPESAEVEWIAEVAEATLAQLPDNIATKLGNVAAILEPRPSLELVKSGFDSRALGLFEGPTSVEHGMLSAPPELSRIVLYTGCLVDAFGTEREELEAQVRITVLHEIGHYFGLEEDELERLGLD